MVIAGRWGWGGVAATAAATAALFICKNKSHLGEKALMERLSRLPQGRVGGARRRFRQEGGG